MFTQQGTPQVWTLHELPTGGREDTRQLNVWQQTNKTRQKECTLHGSAYVEFKNSPHGFRSPVSSPSQGGGECSNGGRHEGLLGLETCYSTLGWFAKGHSGNSRAACVCATHEWNKPQEASQSLTGPPENENTPEGRRLWNKRVALGMWTKLCRPDAPWKSCTALRNIDLQGQKEDRDKSRQEASTNSASWKGGKCWVPTLWPMGKTFTSILSGELGRGVWRPLTKGQLTQATELQEPLKLGRPQRHGQAACLPWCTLPATQPWVSSPPGWPRKWSSCPTSQKEWGIISRDVSIAKVRHGTQTENREMKKKCAFWPGRPLALPIPEFQDKQSQVYPSKQENEQPSSRDTDHLKRKRLTEADT